MTNEETNKTVEEEMAVIAERIEEIDKEAELEVERHNKLLKRLDLAYNAVGVFGFGMLVAAVIKESIK